MLMPFSLDEIRVIVADAVAPRHFFVGNGLELEWEHAPAENIPWEIYKGRLLDASQTRERRTFEAWNIYSIDEFGRSTEPLLSVKLNTETRQIHVVRAILCYAWEAYDAGDNVILSRETTKWVRELVGTILPEDYLILAFFARELPRELFRAVIGVSRLALTSLEAPLPAFSLGRWAYFYREKCGEDGPLRSWRELLDQIGRLGVNDLADVKLFEFFLRATPWEALEQAAGVWMDHITPYFHGKFIGMRARSAKFKHAPSEPLEQMIADPARCGREFLQGALNKVFIEVALTPYTDFVQKVLAFAEILEKQGRIEPANVADFLSRLLRQLGRHLTAYDLITFHHRGANYPDALLLDSALKAYVRLIERSPELFLDSAEDDEKARNQKRLRRRALRQGWLMRRSYEGHPVPDAPTSPGENARVLPPPHVRVPEEQIFNPAQRRKRLYDSDPLVSYLGDHARHALHRSIEDLRHGDELRELGMATFLDRPFGGGKQPNETNETLLLSYQAFSRTVARRRLDLICSDDILRPDSAASDEMRNALDALLESGVPVQGLPGLNERGIVSLGDALRVADDFLVLRTTAKTWLDLCVEYRFLGTLQTRFSLHDLRYPRPVLVLRETLPGAARETIGIYDSKQRKRLALDFDPREGYVRRNGVERPISPLRVLRVWEYAQEGDDLRAHDLMADPDPILLRPI
jgi:hypothetical protein